MDNCLVCWENNDDTISSRIYIKLRVWKEYTVQHIIEKHLSWWHLRKARDEKYEPWICLQCWQELLTFHKFYERVENINQNIFSQNKLKTATKANLVMHESIDSENDDCDSPINSPKRKRTKEDHEIEELSITDVKSVSNIFVPETILEDPFSNMDSTPNSKNDETKYVTLDANEFKLEIKSLLQTELKNLRRNIQNDINKLEEKIIVVSSSTTDDISKKISDYKDLLNLHEPFQDLQSFYEFDSKLRMDKEYVLALRELMSIKVRTKSLTDSIGAVVSMVIIPELQMRFSACGKPNKGVSKENFSATKIYNELKDYLLSVFHSETEATILSKTSRWLASSKDRYVGRNSRDMDKCIVCWEDKIETVSSRIYNSSKEWRENNVQHIIEKYLVWWQPYDKDNAIWICPVCWKNLLSFHKFYIQVEKVNQYHSPVKSLKNVSRKDNSLMEDVMQNISDSDNEDLTSLASFKIIDSNREMPPNIELDEINIVDIKMEPELCTPDQQPKSIVYIKTEPDLYTLEQQPSGQEQSRNVGLVTKDAGNQTDLITLNDDGFKTQLREMLNSEFSSLRRGFSYDINKIPDKIAVISTSIESNAKIRSDFMEILNIQEPFNDLQLFYEFDNRLRTNKEFLDEMRKFLSFTIRPKSSITDAISAVISMLITPELQLKFSGCGKPNKGISKENFSATKTYNELKDSLLCQFVSESDKTILSKTSRWLSSVKERMPGAGRSSNKL